MASTDYLYSPAKSITRSVGTGGVLAGRLVERASDGTVVLATAGSVLVDGVAEWDESTVGNNVTVNRGMNLRVSYTGAVAPGTKLISAANGQVSAAGATPDARTIIGRCEEVVAGAGLGSAYIYG